MKFRFLTCAVSLGLCCAILSGCCCFTGLDLSGLAGVLTPEATQQTLPPATAPVATAPVATAPPTTEAETEPYVPYSDCGLDGGYVLRESNKRYYSRNELWPLTPDELTVARWEICARHGYVPEDPDLAAYFLTKDWYTPSDKYDDDDLSKLEKNNAAILDACIDKRRGITMSEDNPYKDFTQTFLIEKSDEVKLTKADLAGMTADYLKAARNEIFARHGYIFKNRHLYEYFMTKDWYFPTVLSSQSDRYSLSKTEQANVDTIKARESSVCADLAASLVTLKEKGSHHNAYADFEYRAPKIQNFGPGAVSVQKKIDKQLQQILDDVKECTRGQYSCDYWAFDYEASVHKNMLFISIWIDYLSGDGWYTIYAMDLDTGAELDRAGVLAKLGVSKDTYMAAVKKAATASIKRLKDEGYADGEYYQFLLDQTLNTKNLEASQLYYKSNGTAYVVMDVATVAGSGVYNAMLKIDLG